MNNNIASVMLELKNVAAELSAIEALLREAEEILAEMQFSLESSRLSRMVASLEHLRSYHCKQVCGGSISSAMSSLREYNDWAYDPLDE